MIPTEMIPKIRKLLVSHEDNKLFPYTDTIGKLTIGIGRNLTDKGISQSESDFMCYNDMVYFYEKLVEEFPWFELLNEARQVALIDMCFNIGFRGFLEFKEMISALSQQKFNLASQQMLDSKWSKQVPSRAQDLSRIIKEGELA